MNLYIWTMFLFLMISLAAAKIRNRIRMKKELRRRQQIGKMGEEDTLRRLEKIRGSKRILQNLYVPMHDGVNTTEIDAVMIHEKGIFVIENKNYSGRIYGDEQDYQWTQIQKQGRKKVSRSFYNPIRQNETHIGTLKRFLAKKHLLEVNGRRLPIVSIITFNDKAKLKRISVDSRDVLISESRKIRRRLRRKMRWMTRVLTRKQIEQISEELKELEHPGRRVQRQHGRYVRHN